MLDVMYLNRDAIREKYKKYIREENLDNYTIIAENTSEHHGIFKKSDLIFKFTGEGELIVFAERVYRKDCSKLEWFRLKRRLPKILREAEINNEVDCTYAVNKDYVDVTLYKEWWYEWAKGLI